MFVLCKTPFVDIVLVQFVNYLTNGLLKILRYCIHRNESIVILEQITLHKNDLGEKTVQQSKVSRKHLHFEIFMQTF